jgi:hypothetical protein
MDRSLGRRLPESLAQSTEGARQARLHGSARDPQHLGRFGLWQVEQVPRDDDLAVVVAEIGQGAQEREPRLLDEDRRLGRWGRIGRAAVLDGPKREPGSPVRGAAAVACLVRDDPQEPRPKRRPRSEPRECAIRLHERLLGRVLGVVRSARDEMRRSDGDVLVAANELLVRRHLASARALDQLGLFRWTALHGQPYPYTGRIPRVPEGG